VEDVIVLSAPECELHNVEIARELPAEALPAKIDADLVKQAVLNVVLNAVQAMSEGGKLTLAAHNGDRGIEVQVRDTGPGIPPEIRDKIFDLYFTTKKSGSGIGLAMTFRVMQLHNGSVDFSSGPHGTTFFLRFPPLAEAGSSNVQEMAAR
jgi:signal transduction histidine kinase